MQESIIDRAKQLAYDAYEGQSYEDFTVQWSKTPEALVVRYMISHTTLQTLPW